MTGLSQELLAEKCGITLRTVQRIEKDKSIPRPYTLKVIADTLNLKVVDLETNFNSEQKTSTTSEITINHSLSKINLINSSALLGIFFPFLNFIAPTIFWKLNNKNPLVRERGLKIINFQILWTLFSISILVVAFLYLRSTGIFVFRGISIEFLIYLFLLIVNVFFIFKNSIQLNKGNMDIYAYFPNLF